MQATDCHPGSTRKPHGWRNEADPAAKSQTDRDRPIAAALETARERRYATRRGLPQRSGESLDMSREGGRRMSADTRTANEVPVWARTAVAVVCWGLGLAVLAVSIYTALNPQPVPWTEPEGIHLGSFLARMVAPTLLVAPILWAGWFAHARWRSTSPMGPRSAWIADLLVAGAYAVTLGLVAYVFAEGMAYQLTGRSHQTSWWQLSIPLYVPFALLAIRRVRWRYGVEGVGVAVGLWAVATFGLFTLYVLFIGG